MNAIDPGAAKSIFHAALDLPTPEERGAYLDEVCAGNLPLRRRVEELLRGHEQVGSLLERPAIDPLRTTCYEPIAEKPGTVIGRYKLLEQIGEGGMGVVFMAEQIQPVRRKVALKIVKPGMDSRQVIARFEAERQALALMDHPNIARVLDGGSTGERNPNPEARNPKQIQRPKSEIPNAGEQAVSDIPDSNLEFVSDFGLRDSDFSSGRPYFVMELVQGIPITEYCDRSQVALQQRLELFVQVCHAVQHAHQKGIIHRDIKPTNVLVTLHDGVPVPKVIDFGVAKAIGQELTERTLFTNFAQMIGTPLYMSPEQAALSGMDVDTRSDVYSLGVLLYEMLTGTTPFEQNRLREACYDEMRRIIHEEEPPRPSTRVTTLRATCTADCPHCQGQPRDLVRRLRGELDWIVMKCLEKDRTRRYESASALAADVERYLRDEPVVACPPSAAYRFRKYAWRHKRAITAAGLVVVAMFVGTAISVWQAIEANAARDLAGQRLVLADERLDNEKQARSDADAERQRAEANYRAAREAVQMMVSGLANEQLAFIPQMKEARRRVLEDAAQCYTKLIELNPRDAAAYYERAYVYDLLADYGKVRGDYEKAIELQPNNAEYRQRFGHFLRACPHTAFWDVPQAVIHFQRAVELEPKNPQYYAELGNALCMLGRRTEGVAVLRKTLEVAPDSAFGYLGAAMACEHLGDAANAVKYYEKLIQIAPKESSFSHARLTQLYWDSGQRERAIATATSAIEDSKKTYGEWGDSDRFWWYCTRGDVYARLGRHREALADYDKAVESAPTHCFTFKRRAIARFHLKQYDQALADIVQAVQLNPADSSNLTWISPTLVASCPDEKFRIGMIAAADKTIELTKGSADAFIARAALHAAMNHRDQARADLAKALATGTASHYARYQHALLCLALGDQAAYRKTCAEMLPQFARTENPDEAYFAAWTAVLAPRSVADYAPAIELARRAVKLRPNDRQAVQTLGAALFRAGQFEDAVKQLTAAEDAGDGANTCPAYGWYFLAMAHHSLGHREEAKKWFDKAAAHTPHVLPDTKGDAETLSWNRRLTLELLDAEAKALVGSADKPSAGKTEKGK